MCGYEVPGMILLSQALYLDTDSLLRGVTFELHPLGGYALKLNDAACHGQEHFWNPCCTTAFSAVVTFFGCLLYPEIFIPLRQTLFLETARSHSVLN
jgi:hypothetical protein